MAKSKVAKRIPVTAHGKVTDRAAVTAHSKVLTEPSDCTQQGHPPDTVTAHSKATCIAAVTAHSEVTNRRPVTAHSASSLAGHIDRT